MRSRAPLPSASSASADASRATSSIKRPRGHNGAMRVTVIGCAGSFPGPDSPASCYLLEAEGFRLVIDMGNGALGVLQRYAELFGIDAICLSHLHADHCVDLGAYWVARRYTEAGPRPAIPVYGPRGTAA